MARQSNYKAARQTVNKQKKKVILQYMKENPDLVINSSVTVIKGLRFGLRFKYALDILRGNGRKRRMEAYMDREAAPEKKAGSNHPSPDVTPPAAKPKKDGLCPEAAPEDYLDGKLRNL